ncbi:hypothetical protein [Pedobacter psychrodurus]|uniref:hypothetical protein n=1 Tax=Pedobacter psychrodurus TaxID=2530456 RepID=UPI0029304F5D|nr:hypothetical protein [Pedobacter psychrodurus]
MEKYITENSKWFWLFIIALFISCTIKSDKTIPKDIILKSTDYTVGKYKRYLNPKVYILKNEFTEDVKTVNTEGIEVNLVDEKDLKSTEVSTIEFYKFTHVANGDVELEMVLMPRRQYVRFHFTKASDETWI